MFCRITFNGMSDNNNNNNNNNNNGATMRGLATKEGVLSIPNETVNECQIQILFTKKALAATSSMRVGLGSKASQ